MNIITGTAKNSKRKMGPGQPNSKTTSVRKPTRAKQVSLPPQEPVQRKETRRQNGDPGNGVREG